MIQRPHVYTTTHRHSKVICSAFAQGCKGKQVLPPVAGLFPGPAAMYGILRGTGEAIKTCIKMDRDYYHIDHGYFLPGHYEGYYRVTKNGQMADGTGNYPSDRWDFLNIQMKPWRTAGEHIVVCPISRFVAAYEGIDETTWTNQMVADLKKFTDRPIIIKPKDSDQLLSVTIQGAHALVCYNSMAALNSILDGIPAFAIDNPAIGPVSLDDISQIEEPKICDREQWAYNLAYSQWTLDEFRNGTCWRMVK